MARTKSTETPLLSDLLEQDVETLTADSPAPADDPLSLVRSEVEEKPTVGIAEDAPAALKPGDRVGFYVLVDKFYILDRMLRKGEQIWIVVGNGIYNRTVDDRTGRSWIEDLHDPELQMRRWGKVPFALGIAPDPRAELIAVPEWVAEEHADDFRKAVLDAADQITANR